jgi:hypothetical protein
MNASQARSIKPVIQMDDTEIQLQFIYSRVEIAARNGLTHWDWGEQLSNDVVKKLTEEGYKVMQGFDDYGFYCKIDWQ